MTWRITNDELARLRIEVPVSHIDGNALLTFCRQAIGQQCQIGFALALYTSQVVLQHGFGVNQQATNEGALAIVDRAAGDEFQGVGVWGKKR